VTKTGRVARLGWLVGGLVALCACQTVTEPFPSQGALSLDVTYSALGTQLAAPPAPQAVIWTIDEASASDITGFDGEFSFLRPGPCFYPLNVLSLQTMSRACRVSGLSLAPSVERSAVLKLRVTAMELRQAARPDLRLGADPDGDGIPNGADNCPIVFNPIEPPATEQADVNNDNVGDACSKLDTQDPPQPTIPDFDLDTVSNAVDNCLWYPSPPAEGSSAPPDSDRDGIGDVCERIAPVILPTGGLTVTCAVTFTARSAGPSLFRLDFAREGVLTCDSGFTGCAIDGSQLEASLTGSSETFPCEVADSP
jgi:hypothetical protein